MDNKSNVRRKENRHVVLYRTLQADWSCLSAYGTNCADVFDCFYVYDIVNFERNY